MPQYLGACAESPAAMPEYLIVYKCKAVNKDKRAAITPRQLIKSLSKTTHLIHPLHSRSCCSPQWLFKLRLDKLHELLETLALHKL